MTVTPQRPSHCNAHLPTRNHLPTTTNPFQRPFHPTIIPPVTSPLPRARTLPCHPTNVGTPLPPDAGAVSGDPSGTAQHGCSPPTPLVVEGSDSPPRLGGPREGWGTARQMDGSDGGTSAGWSPAPQFRASRETLNLALPSVPALFPRPVEPAREASSLRAPSSALSLPAGGHGAQQRRSLGVPARAPGAPRGAGCVRPAPHARRFPAVPRGAAPGVGSAPQGPRSALAALRLRRWSRPPSPGSLL